MSKPFLITAHARSGTKYTSQIFQKLGYDVLHEQMAGDGVVSYRHAKVPERFSKIVHQTRWPLKVFRSALVLDPRTQYWRTIKATKRDPKISILDNKDDALRRIMYSWIHWNLHLEGISSYRFKIEDLSSCYEELFVNLNLKAPNKLPEIKPTTNTWKKNKDYLEKVTWPMLENIDGMLATGVRRLAGKYGY